MLKASKLFVILALPGVAINTASADSSTTAPTTIMGSIFTGAKFTAKAAVNSAKSTMGFIGKASCQAFYDKRECDKADEMTTVAKDTASVVSVGTTAVVVSGASGAGIMHTVAAAGAAIGGGAVAGIAAIGGGGGFGAAHLMNQTVYSDCQDQTACGAAQVGTYTGAAVGTAGGIAAISTAGVAGLSGAGITSGLAAIGATVGGGMAAGTALVIAAPIVAATATGAAVYWAFSGWNQSKPPTSSPENNSNK